MIAQTILDQLGGSRRLSMMIGAHTFTDGGSALTFKFKARAKNGANCCRIILSADDTYRVEFISLRGVKVNTKGDFEMVYADGLKQLFENQTGLYLSL